MASTMRGTAMVVTSITVASASIFGLMLVMTSLLYSILHTEREAVKKAPPLPVLGRFPVLSAEEYLIGQILLDAAGNYKGEVERARGRFNYTVRFTPLDQERKRFYQQKPAMPWPKARPGSTSRAQPLASGDRPTQLSYRRRSPSSVS